jgi:hypothetical protein
MRCASLLLLAALSSCSRTARVEVGARTTFDGDPLVRVGISAGAGLASSGGNGALTQSIGYQYARGNRAIFTTRVLERFGPVYGSGAFEIDHHGDFDFAPSLAVPVYRQRLEPRGSDPMNLLSIGLQLRLGRHDGMTTAGADLVFGYDELNSHDFGP